MSRNDPPTAMNPKHLAAAGPDLLHAIQLMLNAYACTVIDNDSKAEAYAAAARAANKALTGVES